MYKCPKCEGKLDLVISNDIKVDKCVSCGGIWFDNGELHKLLTNDVNLMIDGLESSSTKEMNKQVGECPLCHDYKLERIESKLDANLAIDRCPSCKGIWLERGELTELTLKAKKTDLLDIIKA